MNGTLKISPLPLGSIKMTGDYCKNALEKESDYLEAFDEDRVLAGFRLNAGLKTSAAPYGGWESHLIGGHAMGHYFSALAQAAVNPALHERRRRALRDKLERIIRGLSECQLENGFLWAGRISDPGNVEVQFDLVEQGHGNDNIIEVAWVPWYTMHKILAGLLAAYSIAKIDMALDIAKKLGNWVCRRTESWDYNTRQTVLSVEYGGMNDVMYELYGITGEGKYADAAHAFDEENLFSDILGGGHNLLTGRHANTTIPKVIGLLKRYLICHGRTVNGKHPEKVEAEGYLRVAEIFWDNVISHHTYHTGGNSEWEHFREDDSLDKNRTNANCETCNVYNMLKLTAGLFEATGEKKYADYLETAFYNHILASQNPKTGMTTYFQSMATGYFKVFSSRWEDFWCCTGSGMENFTKLGSSAAFGDENKLWIIKYLPAEISAGKTVIKIASDEAQENISVEIAAGKCELMLRVPDWTDGMSVAKNGVEAGSPESGFFGISVAAGDVLKITTKPRLNVVGLSDSPDVAALKYGPWLLAAKLGTADMTETRTGVNVAIPEKPVGDGVLRPGCGIDALRAAPEKYAEKTGECEFRLGGLTFIPYYRIEERYGIYWRIAD